MDRSCRAALFALIPASLLAACGGAFVETSAPGVDSRNDAAHAGDVADDGSRCPGVACDLDCSDTGWLVDGAGCPVCECAPPCVCEDGTACAADGGCGIDPDECPPTCDRFCPYGNRYDDRGCELCECNEGPIVCESDRDCPEGQRCTPEESARAVRVCEDFQCPILDCAIRCADGFVTGDDGCPICECAPSVGCADPAACPPPPCDPADTDCAPVACDPDDAACAGEAPRYCHGDDECADGERCLFDATVAGDADAGDAPGICTAG